MIALDRAIPDRRRSLRSTEAIGGVITDYLKILTAKRIPMLDGAGKPVRVILGNRSGIKSALPSK